MSIVTKTGDDGSTRLLFNHKVMKSDLRVDAYGGVDELNAALGMLKAHLATPGELREWVHAIQEKLITVMGELCTPTALISKFDQAGFQRVGNEEVAVVDARIRLIEDHLGPFTDWHLPGGSEAGALADWARTICRRAERTICALHQAEPLQNELILVYLNRLSDWLWLEARNLDANQED